MKHVVAAVNARDVTRASADNALAARNAAKVAFDAATAVYDVYAREMIRLRALFAATNANLDAMIDVRIGVLPSAAHEAATEAVRAASLYVLREAVPLADSRMATLAARLALLGDA